MSIVVRTLLQQDREAVRKICCDVAHQGERVENIFPDREVAADLLTGYYLDFEPSSTLVAQVDGQVVGYLNGCLDNRRYGLVIVFLIVPFVLSKAFIRGNFLNKQALCLLKQAVSGWRRVLRWRKYSFSSHKGHFHIGIDQRFRHQGIGRLLVERFLELSLHSHVDMVMASVHRDNRSACYFFESLGFYRQQQEVPAVVTYVKKIS